MSFWPSHVLHAGHVLRAYRLREKWEMEKPRTKEPFVCLLTVRVVRFPSSIFHSLVACVKWQKGYAFDASGADV